jgi:phosphopantothenoylcysteine decarboxylase/phosphopantothenate--cysteine ligase
VTAFQGRTVVLGVCGGIAAYKAVELCRRLVDAGAHVVPVLTDDAQRFVGTATFSALASEKVQTTMWDGDDPIPHTSLGRRADLVLVAPATANFLARYAGGMADDLLTATLLATEAPVVVCPAMHTEMWDHRAVQDNVSTLWNRGVSVVAPAAGRLAGGDEGTGRLADTDDIVDAAERALSKQTLSGVSVLVTAGGTREPVDAVRFLGNRSSGKQGYAIAREAALRGANVTLVTTAERRAPSGVDVIPVETADEMAREVLGRYTQVVVMAGAVADFRPLAASDGKIDKSAGLPAITLEPTVDILARLGERKGHGRLPFLVGFAAEFGAEHLEERATAKLRAKGVDLIVANDVSDPDTGFGSNDNRAALISADGSVQRVPLVGKAELARIVVDAVEAHLDKFPIRRKL